MRGAILAGVPLGGALILTLLARDETVYRWLVREDSVLEWAQVAVYAFVVVAAGASLPRLWREHRRSSALVLGALALGSLIAIGEEVSWGQRLIGFDTPDPLAGNRQQEANLHNDSRIEPYARLAMLVAGVYGVVVPLLVRSPFAPPRSAIAFFAVVAAYFAFRLLFLDAPTYVQAKYSEWPELCLAGGIALWCVDLGRRRSDLVAAREAP